MRLVFALCLVTGCATLPSAEEPCAGVQSYKDDFGKESRGLLVYFDNGFRASGLVAENGKLFLRALFALNGVMDVTIPAGAPAQVALMDGSVLDVQTAKAAPPVAGANPYAVFTQWGVDFELTAEQRAKLQAAGLRAIKLPLGINELLVRADDDTGSAMGHLTQCLAPEAPAVASGEASL